MFRKDVCQWIWIDVSNVDWGTGDEKHYHLDWEECNKTIILQLTTKRVFAFGRTNRWRSWCWLVVIPNVPKRQINFGVLLFVCGDAAAACP